MNSWWRLGEGIGYSGDTVSPTHVTCAFCNEKGNFRIEHQATKTKPNSKKALHFDTWQCNSCAAYVLIFWSASEYGGLHDFKVLPWPLRYDRYPESWPEPVGRFWLQAKRNLADGSHDAAVVMARSAMQAALRNKGATGSNLKQEIESLAKSGELPPIIQDWSTRLRELGNESAHPEVNQEPVRPTDAEDIIRFLDFLLEYLYDLPQRINEHLKRRVAGNGT